MGYNPFCQYYHHRSISQPQKGSTGLQSFFGSDRKQQTIRVHECYYPENLDAAGKLRPESWTCDRKIECPFKLRPR